MKHFRLTFLAIQGTWLYTEVISKEYTQAETINSRSRQFSFSATKERSSIENSKLKGSPKSIQNIMGEESRKSDRNLKTDEFTILPNLPENKKKEKSADSIRAASHSVDMFDDDSPPDTRSENDADTKMTISTVTQDLSAAVGLSTNPLFDNIMPTTGPSMSPSWRTNVPSVYSSNLPSQRPSVLPSIMPTTSYPSSRPTHSPSIVPTMVPSITSTIHPSYTPSFTPTLHHSIRPSYMKSVYPTHLPTATVNPTCDIKTESTNVLVAMSHFTKDSLSDRHIDSYETQAKRVLSQYYSLLYRYSDTKVREVKLTSQEILGNDENRRLLNFSGFLENETNSLLKEIPNNFTLLLDTKVVVDTTSMYVDLLPSVATEALNSTAFVEYLRSTDIVFHNISISISERTQEVEVVKSIVEIEENESPKPNFFQKAMSMFENLSPPLVTGLTISCLLVVMIFYRLCRKVGLKKDVGVRIIEASGSGSFKCPPYNDYEITLNTSPRTGRYSTKQKLPATIERSFAPIQPKSLHSRNLTHQIEDKSIENNLSKTLGKFDNNKSLTPAQLLCPCDAIDMRLMQATAMETADIVKEMVSPKF